MTGAEKTLQWMRNYSNANGNDPSAFEIRCQLEMCIEQEKRKAENLPISDVSKSLLIKKYEIDFDGNVLAGIEISENTPKVFGAMNGYGNGISIENIKITEK